MGRGRRSPFDIRRGPSRNVPAPVTHDQQAVYKLRVAEITEVTEITNKAKYNESSYGSTQVYG